MALRPIQQADLDWVVALDRTQPGSPGWPRSVYEGLLDAPEGKLRHFALIADQNGQPAALLVARLLLDGVENLCELEWVVVEETFRRGGLAQCLLVALVEWARGQGANSIRLEVRAGNQAALALYRRSGFEPVGRRKTYYRNPPEDAVEMQFHL